MKSKIEMKKLVLITCVLLVAEIATDVQQSDFPKLAGPFLGQKPPEMTPELFAPGVVAGIEEHQRMDYLEFIARVTSLIPDNRQVMVMNL